MADIKTYTTKEAEKILKVKSRTICDYIKGGKLKASKVGRGWLINQEDIEAFIKSNS